VKLTESGPEQEHSEANGEHTTPAGYEIMHELCLLNKQLDQMSFT
jgi:hypothetical protein